MLEFNDTEAQRIGQLIKNYRKQQRLTQEKLRIMLEKQGIKLDVPVLSRLESGKVSNYEQQIRICEQLGINYAQDNRLAIAYGQGLWATPLILLDQYYADSSLRKMVRFTAYKDVYHNPIWSNNDDKLMPFQKEKHSYYYSGKILEMLNDEEIDIGFVGSTIVDDDNNTVRAARVTDLNNVRHSIVVAAPKNRFKTQEDVLAYLLRQSNIQEKCRIYYLAKSTAEQEFCDLLQWTDYDHDSIAAERLGDLNSLFQEELKNHDGWVIGYMGINSSMAAVSDAIVHCKGIKTAYQSFIFETTAIIEYAAKHQIDHIKSVRPLYLEMIVRRSNEKITSIATNQGFKEFIKKLQEAINDLEKVKHDSGTPLIYKKAAHFLGIEEQEVRNKIRNINFELLYYPEFLGKILNGIS